MRRTMVRVFGRRQRERSPVGQRLDEARGVIERHAPLSPALHVLDEVERSLESAVADCVRLERTIEQLNPTAATQELKVVLRQRAVVTLPDTPRVEALRRRHDTVHGLMNRLYDLRCRMEQTLVDVDTLVAQSVTASVAPVADDPMLRVQIHQLTTDATALAAAHDELSSL